MTLAMKKSFAEVFKKLDLNTIKPAWTSALVESVVFNDTTKQLEISLAFNNPENGLDKSSAQLDKSSVESLLFDQLQTKTNLKLHMPELAPRPIITNKPENANRNGNKAYSNGYSNGSGNSKYPARPKAFKDIEGEVTKLNQLLKEDDEVVIEGRIFSSEAKETRSGKTMFSIEITDGAGSISLKYFVDKKHAGEFKDMLKKGNDIKVAGRITNDIYTNEMNVMVGKVAPGTFEETKRIDEADEKRVELHLHTNMSALDALGSVKAYINQAVAWGHKAIAITDHGVVQGFPEAMATVDKLKKDGKDIKVIYGMEAYVVDDMGVSIASRPKNAKLSDDFVVFDLETTGLNREANRIIEIGAVRMRGGQIGEIFHTFVDPEQELPAKITEITTITEDMLKGQPKIEEILPDFLAFVGEATLVAHNADFDMGFLEASANRMGIIVDNPYLCTLQLSRALLPGLHRHGLAAMVKHYDVTLENHHRASDDAKALAEIFAKQIEFLKSHEITTLDMINLRYAKEIDIKTLRPNHAILLVKDQVGMRNLYELVSISHIDHFNRYPRIPKSKLSELREGLILGTACEQGELYSAVRDNRPIEHIEQIAAFYDYFEVQPIGNNMFYIKNGDIDNVQALQDINKKIIEYGETYEKLVVAAGDVHFKEPTDAIYRTIIQTGNGFKDADDQAPLYLRTTNEMLAEFEYLDKEIAHKIVITNPNKLADLIPDDIRPIPNGMSPPVMEGSDADLEEMVWSKAKSIYGDPLPEYVQARIERELGAIIKNNFAVMYMIAQKLVAQSMDDGYVVGSRGSIGSSIVATMSGITEVNPLEPHYHCPNADCLYTDFNSEIVLSFRGESGCDMPDAACPKCNTQLKKDGHSIPFETFLGFEGEKAPDIDLNFSGEYQSTAHANAEKLLGEGQVFKAGTISTIASKTAFGYVKKYMELKNRLGERKAELNRLASGCEGMKRTTGQHPGGLMVVPQGRSVYEFTPVQRPANDQKSNVTTTHFDYHSIHDNLLKLDLLGHDVPTIFRMLLDHTGLHPFDVDIGNKETIALFTDPSKLNLVEQNASIKTGSLGLPEFGTGFVRGMLMDTKPKSFADLVRISGLSHGTDVWLGNGAELIKAGTASLQEIISTRDNIMIYLIQKGLPSKDAFDITEKVRKGKGVTDDEEELMLDNGVPHWYIESCRRIKYMFPKGHAVAYVANAVRMAYFKIHHPTAFYAAAFSVKSDEFDYEIMCRGRQGVIAEMERVNNLGKEATQKDEKSMTMLELVNEMYARGLEFLPLDIYKSQVTKFLIIDGKLLPPLVAIQGLGLSIAELIAQERENGEFFSIEDLKERTKVNKNVVQLLKDNGILNGIPETEQMSLF